MSFFSKLLGAKPTEDVFPTPLTPEQLRAVSLSAILQMNATDRCNTRLYPLKYINKGIAQYELQVKHWDVATPEDLVKTLRMLTGDDLAVNTPNGPALLPVAWRAGTIVDIARFAYAAEYINEADAWELIMPAVKLSANHYPSWREYAQDFLIGAVLWWGNTDLVNRDLAAKFQKEDEAAVQKLLDPQNAASPWNQVALK